MAGEDTDRSGQIIDGRYRLESLLDRGGQGVVYRALDLREGDHVAIKMLKASFVHDADSRERLLREARALMTLANTAAVRVLDQRWSHGELFVVMELLQGSSLDEHLDHMSTPMSAHHLVDLLEPVAQTLQRAHEHGIVHRDVKPANIFVCTHGDVRLIDFGFAKFANLLSFTASGSAAGSPSYMAPEIWNAAAIDHRVDVYSLGVVVYRSLTGRVPFDPNNLALLWRAVTTAPRPSLRVLRPDLPLELDGWTTQAMAIDPNQRFLSVRAAWKALRHTVALQGSFAPPA